MENVNKQLLDAAKALESCNWSGVPIGNKAVIAQAVKLLQSQAIAAAEQAHRAAVTYVSLGNSTLELGTGIIIKCTPSGALKVICTREHAPADTELSSAQSNHVTDAQLEEDGYVNATAAQQQADPVAWQLFKQALFVGMERPCIHYLMANAHGRRDGALKAHGHEELCKHIVAAVRGCDPDLVRRQHEDDYQAVHDGTQALTSYLDEVIGFPLDSRPDYDDLTPKFFDKFFELAMAALGVSPVAQPPAVAVPVEWREMVEAAIVALKWYADIGHVETLSGKLDWPAEREKLKAKGFRCEGEHSDGTEVFVEYGDMAAAAVGKLRAMLAAAPQAADPIKRLIAMHNELLGEYPYCYFELAYTRRTDWMAWLCTKPREDDPERKVLACGQGLTAEDACAEAISAAQKGGSQND